MCKVTIRYIPYQLVYGLHLLIPNNMFSPHSVKAMEMQILLRYSQIDSQIWKNNRLIITSTKNDWKSIVELCVLESIEVSRKEI
jgi:hypothetical protein